jgi:hypothetical protein
MSSKSNQTSSSPSHHTIQQYLSTKPPTLRPLPPKGFKKSNSRSPQWVRPAKIVHWDEFTLTTLTESCQGLFSEILRYPIQPMDFSHLEDTVTEFSAEHSLDMFLSKWTHTIVQQALFRAQQLCNDMQTPFVDMVPGCDAWTPQRKLPDWAGVRRLSTRSDSDSYDHRPINMLPGDTKVSYKWNSKEIKATEVGRKKKVPEWLWPIMQVFTYCIRLDTRYGYIVTDEEVVIFRVTAPRMESAPSKTEAKPRFLLSKSSLEFASIDYQSVTSSARGREGKTNLMTLNMALWWLHLLAANNRSIQPKYPPLRDEILQDLAAEFEQEYPPVPSSVGSTQPYDSFALSRQSSFAFGGALGASFASTPSRLGKRARRAGSQETRISAGQTGDNVEGRGGESRQQRGKKRRK